MSSLTWDELKAELKRDVDDLIAEIADPLDGPPVSHAAWVEAHQAYLVGEHGPEVYVPKTDGRVLSHAESVRLTTEGMPMRADSPAEVVAAYRERAVIHMVTAARFNAENKEWEVETLCGLWVPEGPPASQVEAEGRICKDCQSAQDQKFGLEEREGG